MSEAPTTADKQQQQRSFTGDKLDWMAAVSADPRCGSREFEVAFQIAQHINMKKGVAFVSDETISDKTGIPQRWVQRARATLRDTGWIDWKRTQSANVYWTLGDNINNVTDHQTILRDARNERRSRAKITRRVSPQVAHLRSWDTPQVAGSDPPQVANGDSPQVANRHLRGTPE